MRNWQNNKPIDQFMILNNNLIDFVYEIDIINQPDLATKFLMLAPCNKEIDNNSKILARLPTKIFSAEVPLDANDLEVHFFGNDIENINKETPSGFSPHEFTL